MNAQQVLDSYIQQHMYNFIGMTAISLDTAGIEGDYPIHCAVFRDSYEEVLALLQGGDDVNRTGDMGNTTLHYSTTQGRLQITELLLDWEANPFIYNEFGETPCDIIRRSANVSLLELLIKRNFISDAK